MDAPYKYWAFISYSHADAAWSDWLFKALETYRVPRRLAGRDGRFGAVPTRLYPVFRDRDELGGSPELSASLVEALSATRCLVVICSPRAARSRWVDEEIRQFKALGGEGRVLALISDGEPHATDPLEECFPPSLRDSEPIAADVRPGRETRQHALLKIIAGIIGVPLDELIQRERQRVRASRVRLAIGAAAAAVGASITGLWILANERIDRDIERGRQAMVARDFGRAAPWLVSAAAMQSRLPFAPQRTYLRAMLGITMAQVEQLESIRAFPGTGNGTVASNASGTRLAIGLREARIVVVALDSLAAETVYEIPQGDPKELRFDEADRGLYYIGDDAVRYLDFATQSTRLIRPHAEGATDVLVTPLGRAVSYRHGDRRDFVALADNRLLARVEKVQTDLTINDRKGEHAVVVTKNADEWQVQIVDLVHGGIASTLHVAFQPRGAAFDPSGKRLVVVSSRTVAKPGFVSVWDCESGRAIWKVPFPAPFRNVAFSPDGKRIATTSMENRAIVWNAHSGDVELILDSDAQIRDADFFADGTRVLTQSQDGSPRVWDLATGGYPTKLGGLDAVFARSFPATDGMNVVAIRTQGPAQMLRWHLEDNRLPRALKGHSSEVTFAGLNADATQLVSYDMQKNAIVWDVRDWNPVARFTDTGESRISKDGRSFFAAPDKSKRWRIFDVGTQKANVEIEHSAPLTRLAGWAKSGKIAGLDAEGRAITIDPKGSGIRTLATFTKPSAIDITPDGSTIAVVAGKSIEFLDVNDGRRVASVPGSAADAWGVEFSENGERLLASYPRESFVIEIASQRKIELKSAGASLVLGSQFICDDDYAAVTLGNYRFQLHDARTGKRLRDFDGATGIVGSVSCDREAGLLMASDLNGSVTVWRLGSSEPLVRFMLAKGRLWSNAWVKTNRTMAIAAEDSRLYLVPLPLESRSVPALEESLRCRVPYSVSGEVLVRDSIPESCSSSKRN